jgi:hypothetical protein
LREVVGVGDEKGDGGGVEEEEVIVRLVLRERRVGELR